MPPGAIAVVGGRPVPRSTLDAQIARTRRAYAAQGRAFPAAGSAAYDELQSIAARLVVERVQAELWAADRGITITAADVDGRLRGLIQESFGGSERRFRAALGREGLTLAEVRGNIRALLVADALRAVPRDAPERPAIAYAPAFTPPDGR